MTIRGRLQAWVLSAVMLAVAPGPVPLLLLGSALVAGDAWAQSRSRSSGGYSRPSPRTPSTAPSYAPPRTPSTSGGYGRPSASPRSMPSMAVPPSASDQAISRDRSAQALRDRQAAQDAARRQAQTPPPIPPSSSSPWSAPPSSGSSWFGTSTRRSPPPPPPADWYGQRGWSAPGYAAAAPRSFGVWDGLFLWFMLDNLTKPGYSNFFRSHQNDPGVQQWRAQADATARENETLRRKLDDLDAQLAKPGDDGSQWVEVPPDVPRSIARAVPEQVRTPSTEDGGGGGMVTLLVIGIVVVGAIAFIEIRRRRARQGDDGMASPIKTATSMLRNVVSPKAYVPAHFRVGMTITADPTPFILAAGATKVKPPEGAGGSALLTVAAVGHMVEGAANMVRLYLPDDRSMFQVYLDQAGNPAECRFFTVFDEVTPADAEEWGVWLDDATGLIGWPEFETRDGKRYARAWAPGDSRIAPQVLVEEVTAAQGKRSMTVRSMLYAAPTGLAAPAPTTEYILVSALERDGEAWVQLCAGIDINPATLGLT